MAQVFNEVNIEQVLNEVYASNKLKRFYSNAINYRSNTQLASSR